MIVRGLRVLAVTAIVVVLCGCAPESEAPPFTAAPPASTSPAVAPVDPSPTPEGPATEAVCESDVAYLSGQSTAYRLAVPCARVEIAGENLRVDLAAAEIGALTIRGQGITVTAGSLSSALIEGQRNTLAAAGVGAGTIRGDGNGFDITGDLGALTVQGTGNTVVAAALGAVTEQGDGNTIGPR